VPWLVIVLNGRWGDGRSTQESKATLGTSKVRLAPTVFAAGLAASMTANHAPSDPHKRPDHRCDDGV
jgi:hypothetical protein